jgi:hypothetical protein
MISLKEFDTVIPTEQCSRSLFTAQRDKLAKLMRNSASKAVPASGKSPEQVKRDEVLRERHIEQRLQRLIVRAKGIVSEEMLVRHQREIPVDEIPDYAVTHLLAQLGERELQLARY